MNQYQDVTEIVDVDADATLVPFFAVMEAAAIIAVYGSSFFSSSVADVAATLSAAMDVAAMTAVYGSSFFSSSVADAVTIHLTITAVAAATVAVTIAANKRNFEDGYCRPFCISKTIFLLSS